MRKFIAYTLTGLAIMFRVSGDVTLSSTCGITAALLLIWRLNWP